MNEPPPTGRDARAHRVAPVAAREWLPALMFVLFVAGFAATTAFVGHVPVADRFAREPAEFDLFKAVIGAVGGFAAAQAAYFVVQAMVLFQLAAGIRPARVAAWAATVLVVGIAVFSALFAGSSQAPASIDRSLALQTRPVVIVAALCAGPGLLDFLVVRAIARDDRSWDESGAARLHLMIRLRAELQRLLSVLGSFLTLLVIATALRRRALLTADPRLHVPAEQVLLYGLIFAVVLGLFFLAATAALDRRAELMLAEFAPLPDPADPDLPQRVARRADLAGLLGQGGSWQTFQSLVVVAAPLLTGLIGSATSN